MHASSMENMRRCIDLYLPLKPQKIIDLGSANVNGSYRELFSSNIDYIGLDLTPGEGVDIVLEDPYHLPFEDDSIDAVISGQMLEHCEHFWLVFNEIERVLKQEGLAFMIAPSSGPVHRYPVDCYRFYPDSYAALASWSGLRLIDSWTCEKGPWRDLVGIFQKSGELRKVKEPAKLRNKMRSNSSPPENPQVDVVKGDLHYTEVLGLIHYLKNPKLYFEIGVRNGLSLSYAKCPSIAVDPEPGDLLCGENVHFHKCTSDDFFFFYRGILEDKQIDLAFIDGMHLAEFVFRDFTNIERHMSPSGVIVVDDILPNNAQQSSRIRNSRVWTGDVWRFALLLERERPDLKLTWLNSNPTGLLVITNLDPENTHFIDNYNSLLRQLDLFEALEPPERILKRTNVVASNIDNLRELFKHDEI